MKFSPSMLGSSLLLLRAVLAAPAPSSTTSGAVPTSTNLNTTSNRMYQLSSDSEFAFVLEEYLSLSESEGAATGEILRAASQIVPGDYESWYQEFDYLAEAMHNMAVQADTTGKDPVGARQAYFRAATYYRGSDFFLIENQTDPRNFETWNKQLVDFTRAMELLPIPGFRVNITAKNFTVPAIFYSACDAHKTTGKNCSAAPTIVMCSGLDGSQEELYHAQGLYWIERGYNLMTYEGPGQPTVRRQQGLGFQPDWWDAVNPVVDWLEKRSDVDMNRLAIYGVSFGGSLAPIAASREPRAKALICIDGLLSFQQGWFETIEEIGLAPLYWSGNKTAFDYVMNSIAANTSMSTDLRWSISQGLWAFATDSPYDYLTRLGQFNVTSQMISDINMPVFIGMGNDDTLSGDAPILAKQAFGSKATLHTFTYALGAGEHCQIGAEAQLGQVTYEWLENVWANQTKTS